MGEFLYVTDLPGLISYFNCDVEGLYFPFMSIIDYLGWRGLILNCLVDDAYA